ncbi:succinate--CoA ligase subunit alpha, partial [Nocardiopsis sp. NPDC060348]
VSGSSGTAAAKKEALEAVGVKVGKTPSETAQLIRTILTGPTQGEEAGAPSQTMAPTAP